ncbi:hypothetical protein HYV98_00390 [Candidatus Azambacteria bacterium]|nr:hypothetical protein [Candidatus Azambacteria bacterium]
MPEKETPPTFGGAGAYIVWGFVLFGILLPLFGGGIFGVTDIITGRQAVALKPIIALFRVFSGLLALGLLVALFLVGRKINWPAREFEEYIATLRMSSFPKRKMLRGWKTVLDLIAIDDPGRWREALIKADDLLDELLKRSGYPGTSVGDRLAKIVPEQLTAIEEVKKAHQIRVELEAYPAKEVSREEIEEAIGAYEQALKDLQLLE